MKDLNVSAETDNDTIELAPRPWVALTITLLGLPLWPLGWPFTAVVSVFGLFLLLQTALLRLRFEADDLVVLRTNSEIRRFPYAEWSNWVVFWPRVPALFYFREVNSIHFLPVLFDATELQQQLKKRIGPSGTDSTEA
tara:strand:+ start:1197 stop:1610 length:414 start_codon:yes stop_codon:yes gene_type:complete